MSKVIRADQKRFFFDLGSNNRGHYLRISEVSICPFPVIGVPPC
jgi:transcriptional activator protein Pur-alpha